MAGLTLSMHFALDIRDGGYTGDRGCGILPPSVFFSALRQECKSWLATALLPTAKIRYLLSIALRTLMIILPVTRRNMPQPATERAKIEKLKEKDMAAKF